MLSPGLYNADSFIYELETSFICNISGDLGHGKTILAVVIAYDLWKRRIVDKLYCNFPMAGRMMDYELGKVNTNFCMILDEPQRVMDARKYNTNKTSDWKRDLRKRNSYLILPGVDPVDVRVRGLEVFRFVMIANLMWVYRYVRTTSSGQKMGWFVFWRPSYYFGSYSTGYSPTISDFQVLYDVMTTGIDNEEEYEHSIMMREQALYNPVEIELENEKRIVIPKNQKSFLRFLTSRK